MPRAQTTNQRLVPAALSALAGAALLLDPELHVRVATPEASKLLGLPVPLGILAPKLLCGKAENRPIAEALAAGRPVQAPLRRITQEGDETILTVRAIPLGKRGEAGWLVLLDGIEPDAEGPVLFHGMWTRTASMKEVFRIIERVAKQDATVLVRGETGTGKELAAQALHACSTRHAGPFRALNCAAVPANLIESELFGHARGAFTGAVRDAPGHIQLAHRGTLFLDEVAELPLELQAKLLRVLETRSVLPVGARQSIAVDVRIVSATHRSLRQEVDRGRFRADLMYRLRVVPIFLPALRERREDISLIAEKLIEQINPTARRPIARIAPVALSTLKTYDWPGNVRELSNALAYAYAIGDGPVLSLRDLPKELLDPSLEPVSPADSRPLRLRKGLDPELQRIMRVLEQTAGNKNRAAQILGISRITLWRKLRALGHESTG